jgi:hypothetical protein
MTYSERLKETMSDEEIVNTMIRSRAKGGGTHYHVTMRPTYHVNRMVNDLMNEVCFQSTVGHERIGIEGRSSFHRRDQLPRARRPLCAHGARA